METKQANAVVTDVFETVVAHLRSGDRVRIGGFGILEVKDRPARMGRNPATGEAVQITASRKVAFRVAKDLKSTIFMLGRRAPAPAPGHPSLQHSADPCRVCVGNTRPTMISSARFETRAPRGFCYVCC